MVEALVVSRKRLSSKSCPSKADRLTAAVDGWEEEERGLTGPHYREGHVVDSSCGAG